MTNRKPSVLVVDDRAEKLLATEVLLSDMPLEVVAVDSGRKALRQLLQRDFAVILLDVDMPVMDGFETAALIRKRKQSEQIPIIFMTAHSDEIFMERGYSLGAVDYILQPVVSEILRAKVGVFVDLFQKSEQVKEQAEWHRRRAEQLQRLAQASIRINSAESIERILERVTETARELIGAARAITVAQLAGQIPAETAAVSPRRPGSASPIAPPDAHRAIIRSMLEQRQSVRLSATEARNNPGLLDKDLLAQGLMAAKLMSTQGSAMGFIEVRGDAFSSDDEAILVLLAQMASSAIENAVSMEARSANQAKDQFLAVLSHELRTPLTPSMAALSELTLDERIPEDVQEELRMVQRNVELEARLIDDLLDLTRISKGKIEMVPAKVDAHAQIDAALKVCQVDISAKGLQVQRDLRAGHPHVRADATRLQQVFWNLIKNAVKFTPSGGKIVIHTENETDDVLSIRITDNGIGIEPIHLPNIFNAFEQGDSDIRRKYGGLGLGLAITKALVERQQGNISVSSGGRGCGATFSLSFPVDRTISKEVAVPLPRLVGGSAMRRLKILLVEDHEDTARVLKRLLGKQSHDVHAARTISEALEVAGRERFDLVISDIGLPDGSGLELMPQLRNRGMRMGIALSGFGMEDDVVRSREAGFHEHLTKPVSFQTLADSIERICTALEAELKVSQMAG